MSERRPSLTLVPGAKWGDEGKGKGILWLATTGNVNLVVRSVGGANAGHSLVLDNGKTYAVHGIPSGILNPEVDNLIAAGCLVNPAGLIKEIDGLENKGVSTKRLHISPRAHMVMPFEQVMDGVQDEAKPKDQQIGTTKQGIGPTTADKALRIGFRIHDLNDPEFVMVQLARVLPEKKVIFDFYTKQRPDYESYVHTSEYQKAAAVFEPDYYPQKLRAWKERLDPYIDRQDDLVNQALDKGKSILLEGAQGTLLDLRLAYPYATSSDTTASGLLAGAGIPAGWIKDTFFKVIGMQKAWESKVGGGPFPTKMEGAIAALYRDPTEFGVTTGRPRMMGWPDGVASLLSQRANRFDEMIITKLDMLYGRGPVKFCVGYEIDGKRVDYPISARDLARVVPIYDQLEIEFTRDISGLKDPRDLGLAERAFLDQHMSFYPGARLLAAGTGRENSAMIVF